MAGNNDMGTSSSKREPRHRDSLTMFQAAPIVWCDHDGNRHALPMLDFDSEKKGVLDGLEDAKEVGADVDVRVEIATTDRLAAFMATGQSPVLHFSCHGDPKYLAIEDGWGAMQPLHTHQLRDFISAGSGHLKVVFVSACFSRPAGQAFVDAGVPHVVCCRTEHELCNSAAIVFTKNFYRTLACGKTLRDAFQLALKALEASPFVEDPHAEANKFLLLPEKPKDASYHDVPVFFTAVTPQVPSIQRQSLLPTRRNNLPPPPKLFVGREITMYNVLECIRKARLVRLHGRKGVGKTSLAKAVSSYLHDRSRASFIKQVFWVPPLPSADDVVSTALREACYIIRQQEAIGPEFEQTCGRVVRALGDAHALVTIDAQEFEGAARSSLELFVDELLRGTAEVKVLSVCPAGSRGFVSQADGVQVDVPPIDMKSSVFLYGSTCPFVSQGVCPNVRTPQALADLLVPDGQPSVLSPSECISRRETQIFSMIGAGIPAVIRDVAANASREDYIELIRMGKRRCNFGSRAELEKEITGVTREQEAAMSSKNFLSAEEFELELKELRGLRSDFPDLPELRTREAELSSALDAASASRAFSNAHNIQMKLAEIGRKIQCEEDAIRHYGYEGQTRVGGALSATPDPVKIYGTWKHVGAVPPGQKCDLSLLSLSRSIAKKSRNSEVIEYVFDDAAVLCAWLHRMQAGKRFKCKIMEQTIADVLLKSHDVPTGEFVNKEDQSMHIWQYEIHMEFENRSRRVIGTKELRHSQESYTEPDSGCFEWLEHVKNDKVIDVYFAVQPPSALLDDLNHQPKPLLEIIENTIRTGKSKGLNELRKRLCSVYLTDGSILDIETEFSCSMVRMFVWCAEGVDELGDIHEMLLGNQWLRKRPPERAVVCMRYGARSVAKKMNVMGVKQVIWMRVDPYSKSFPSLLTMLLLPLIASISSGLATFEASVDEMRKNAIRFDLRCDCDCFTNNETIRHLGHSRGSGEKAVPNFVLKERSSSMADWFQSKEMKRLRMDVVDVPLVGDVKQYVLDSGQNDECRTFRLLPHSHARERKGTWDRTRAVALHVCIEIAKNGAFVFDNGVHRVASKRKAMDVQSELKESTGRALVWIDFVDEENMPFASANEVKDWISRIGTEATLILLVTSAGSCFREVETLLIDLNITGDFEELDAPTGIEVASSSLNCVLCIRPCESEGVQASLLDKIGDPKLLRNALMKLVLDIDDGMSIGRSQRLGQIKIYRDDDYSTEVHISVCDLVQLKRLLDIVYIGKGAQRFAEALSLSKESVVFDCSAFARCYERMILQLAALTEHQCEKLAECSNLKRVHIEGGAGSGKTFLALNSVLDYFDRERNGSRYVLYICRNASLAFHFGKWLCHRFQRDGERNTFLRRTCFLALEMENPLGFKCQMGLLRGVSLSSKGSLSFGKIVVDEAHDIFRKHQDSEGSRFREKVSHLLQQQQDTEIMLLSDLSQASVPGDEVSYPDGMTSIELTQVCRSSKRVIGGAMSFQLAAKDQISFAHESDGLPLRSYLFSASADDREKFRGYANKIVEVLKEILSNFPGLNLHDRLAIVVPDEQFRKRLCEGGTGLSEIFKSHKQELGQHLIPKRALEASRVLSDDDCFPEFSWIVVDSVSEMDGLERLLVLGVGLDEAINEDKSKLQLVRSRIYRAFTRAHLSFFLINERIRGGWFEWLEHLESDMSDFSFVEAVKLANNAAADITSRDARSASTSSVFSSNSRTREGLPGYTYNGTMGHVKLPQQQVEQHPDGTRMHDSDGSNGTTLRLKHKLPNTGIWDVSANVVDSSSSNDGLHSDFVPVAVNRDGTSEKVREAPEESPVTLRPGDKRYRDDTTRSNAVTTLYPHMVKHLQRSLYTCYVTNGKISTKRLLACFSDPRAVSLARRTTSKAGISLPDPPESYFDLPDTMGLEWLENLPIGPGLSPCVNNTCHSILRDMGDKPRGVNTLEFFEILCTMPSLRGVDVDKVRAVRRIQENSEAMAARQTHRGMLTRLKGFVNSQKSLRREARAENKAVLHSTKAQCPEGAKPQTQGEKNSPTVKITFGNTARQVSKDKEWYEWSLFVNPHGYKLERVSIHLPPPFRQKNCDLRLDSDGVFRSLTYNGWATIIVHVDVYFDDKQSVRLEHELGFKDGGCFSVLEVDEPHSRALEYPTYSTV